MQNFTKTRPVGAEFFYANRKTDMTTLIVAFRNLANAPKNSFSKDHLPFIVIICITTHPQVENIERSADHV